MKKIGEVNAMQELNWNDIRESNRCLKKAGRSNLATALRLILLDQALFADFMVALGAIMQLRRAVSDPAQRATLAALGRSAAEIYGCMPSPLVERLVCVSPSPSFDGVDAEPPVEILVGGEPSSAIEADQSASPIVTDDPVEPSAASARAVEGDEARSIPPDEERAIPPNGVSEEPTGTREKEGLGVSMAVSQGAAFGRPGKVASTVGEKQIHSSGVRESFAAQKRW